MAEFDLITCIVQKGVGDKVSKIAIQAGAEGVTIYSGSGTGIRQKLGMRGMHGRAYANKAVNGTLRASRVCVAR